jgi:hypothetical protein
VSVTRARQGPASQIRNLRAQIPAALILLAVAAVGAIVFSDSRAVDRVMHHFRSDWGVHPVGPWAWYSSSRLDPFAEGRLRLLTVALTAVYLGSTTVIGSIVVRRLRGPDHWPFPVSLLAGFLPGYLMVLGPLQVLFAAVPYLIAAWIGLVVLPVVAVLLSRDELARQAKRLRCDKQLAKRSALVLLASIGLVAFAAIHRLQVGSAYLAQDSIRWFLTAAFIQVHDEFGTYLAHWNQQSDEWIFNAPLMFSSRSGEDFLFPIYASQSLSLASFSSLAYGIVHRLADRRRTLAAAVAVGVLLASTPLIFPWRYITIIGGDNPVLWTGHTGRHIGILVPWAVILLAGSRCPRWILGLVVFGLAFTSAENVMITLLTSALVLIWHQLGGACFGWGRRQGVQRAVMTLPIAVFGLILYAFWWLPRASAPGQAAWVLLAAAVLAGAGFVALALGGRASDMPHSGWKKGSTRFAALLGTGVVALVAANNSTEGLLHGQVRSAIGSILPGYREPLLARPDLGEGVLDDLHFPVLSGPGCKNFNYCQGLPDFLASFGLLLVIALATWFVLSPVGAARVADARRAAWLLLVAGLSIAYIAIFFTGARQIQANGFSRLLEVPYYGLLGLAVVAFAGARERATFLVGVGILVVWSVTPLVASRWPEQMARNISWLVRQAVG